VSKTLLLFRHAKSDWDSGYGDDHERPLARRGMKAARLMGRFLARMAQVPDRVLASDAVRARETAKLAIDAGGWPSPLELVPALYDSSPDTVLRLLKACPDSAASVLLAGHEPTWSSTVAMLTGGSSVNFPTAAVCRIDFPIERWSETRPGEGVLVWLVPPRLLSDIGWS
jgi:phosphohistidine phosphatase